MTEAACSDEEFMAAFSQMGAARLAAELGITERSVYRRRRRLEERVGALLGAPTDISPIEHPGRQFLDIEDGVALVFGDAHYWPGLVSTGHVALVKACQEFGKQLRAVICNGDAFDGARISRFPPMNYADRPEVKQEIEACQERLGEIERASGRALRVWNLGNHDARFESRLASQAPEYAGTLPSLKDKFPLWESAWSAWINDDVVVKHRWKGGLHAGLNNTRESGKSIVTHHLHKGVVVPWSDYNGTRYGVDSPCLAEPYGPQFDYQEDNPRNHRSGFVVLTFHKGELLCPEMVLVRRPGEVEFRGRLYSV